MAINSKARTFSDAPTPGPTRARSGAIAAPAPAPMAKGKIGGAVKSAVQPKMKATGSVGKAPAGFGNMKKTTSISGAKKTNSGNFGMAGASASQGRREKPLNNTNNKRPDGQGTSNINPKKKGK